jgi:uncharacterized protein (TIGR02118 family)
VSDVATIVFCLRRLPTVELAEFSTYWRERHAPLFRQYAQALNVVRYTQTHRLEHPLNDALRSSRGGEPAYDGVAQVWFESLDELMAGLTSPAGRAAGAALVEDERAFIDHARSSIWLGEDTEVELT